MVEDSGVQQERTGLWCRARLYGAPLLTVRSRAWRQEKAQRAVGVGGARLGPSTGAALTGSGGAGACGGAGQKLRAQERRHSIMRWLRRRSEKN